MSNNPNPQGKGGTPVLAALTERHASLSAVPPKQIEQISAEMFTSMFVLEAEFRFKPVAGKPYSLFRKPECFWLSMLGPQAWSQEQAGRFIGTCTLQPDMTWTLELSDDAAADSAFMQYLQRRHQAFERHLGEAETVDDVLPVHEKGLSFYRRASAFALAYSLAHSMRQAGIRGLSYEEARGVLVDKRQAADAGSCGIGDTRAVP